VDDPLNHSYYAATRHSFSAAPAQHTSIAVDVVVIGGGFTGLSAALACAEKGFSVTLLEAETIGFGASGRNGGQLIPGLRWTMSEIVKTFGFDRGKAIFNLAWSARDRVWDRIERHSISCDLKSGHLEAAYKPAHFDDMQREAEFLGSQFNYQTEVVSAVDLPAHINGGKYHGGVYDPQGGHFHPLNYAVGLANAAQDAGATITEHAQVSSISDGASVEVRFGDRTITARYAVVATDSWTETLIPALGAFTVPIMNYNVATARLSDADILLPSDAAVADSRFVLNYFRLSADKRLIFGGGERYSTRAPSDIGGFVRKHIAEVFPSLASVPIDYAWGGAVSVTMNRLPHFGRRGNCFFAHGFSGHGALITTLAGELIAEALAGTAQRFDVFARLPHRSFPGGAWLRQPIAALGLFWYALRDRL
jgi:gamma-glutamylputrescine oxidase